MLTHLARDCRCKAVVGDRMKFSRTALLVQNSNPCELVLSYLFNSSFARRMVYRQGKTSYLDHLHNS